MEEFVIPEEVLTNIVVRLPLKDIFRYKLVCKSWSRLISSSHPYFTINYVRNSPNTLIFRVTGGFVDPDKLSYSLIEFAAGKGGENTHHHHILMTPPEIPDHPGPDSRLSFIGSCDCSVFILHRKPFANDHVINRVYSYNPVSGSCVQLVADHRIENWEYMVGFIPSNNTYKLVRFVPGKEKAEKAEIFTVGGLDDEKWRILDDPLLLYGAYRYYEVICLNGAYHWVSKALDDDTICTFNLLEEKSGTRIAKPLGMSPRGLSGFPSRVLTVLKDCLSLADMSEDEHDSVSMVIWRMREYGVVESWSKVAVLTPPNHTFIEKWRYSSLVPLAVLANGDIVFVYKGCWDMCVYNLEEKRLTKINEPPGSAPFYRLYENKYVPSFRT